MLPALAPVNVIDLATPVFKSLMVGKGTEVEPTAPDML